MKKLSNKEIECLTEIVFNKLKEIKNDKDNLIVEEFMNSPEASNVKDLYTKYWESYNQWNTLRNELSKFGIPSIYHNTDKDSFIKSAMELYCINYCKNPISNLRNEIRTELIVKNIFESTEDNFIDSLVDKFKDRIE